MRRKVLGFMLVFLFAGSYLFAADGDLIVNGKVGVGITNPSAKLEIAQGNAIKVGQAYLSSGGDFVNLANNEWYSGSSWQATAPGALIQLFGQTIYFYRHDATGAHSLSAIIDSSGNVGLGGTTVPKGKFSVAFNNDDEIVMYAIGDNALAIQTTLDGQPLSTYGGNANMLILQPILGGVGIGVAPNGYKLAVNGSGWINGIWEPSDQQFKENIVPVQSPLNKITNLQGVTYNWKTEEFKDKGFPEGIHYGVIAQDVEKVLPEIVREGPNGEKAVSYTEIVPVLIEAIKAQQRQIDTLNSKIRALEAKN